MRLFCEHRIPTSAADFWEWIHSADYEARVARALGLTEYRELERREEAGTVYRRLRVAAPLPSSFAPILSRIARVDEVAYVEEQWRSKGAHLVRWRMTPEILAERVRVAGELRLEPAGSRHCRRILEGEISARIFGVGALLERVAIREVVGAYDTAARVAAELAKERRRSARA
jgi:hypothetical protein